MAKELYFEIGQFGSDSKIEEVVGHYNQHAVSVSFVRRDEHVDLTIHRVCIREDLLGPNEWVGIKTTVRENGVNKVSIRDIVSTFPRTYPPYASNNGDWLPADGKSVERRRVAETKFSYWRCFIVDDNGDVLSLPELISRFSLTAVDAPWGKLLFEGETVVGCPYPYCDRDGGETGDYIQDRSLLLSSAFMKRHSLTAITDTWVSRNSLEDEVRFITREVYPRDLRVNSSRFLKCQPETVLTFNRIESGGGSPRLIFLMADGTQIYDHRGLFESHPVWRILTDALKKTTDPQRIFILEAAIHYLAEARADRFNQALTLLQLPITAEVLFGKDVQVPLKIRYLEFRDSGPGVTFPTPRYAVIE